MERPLRRRRTPRTPRLLLRKPRPLLPRPATAKRHQRPLPLPLRPSPLFPSGPPALTLVRLLLLIPPSSHQLPLVLIQPGTAESPLAAVSQQPQGGDTSAASSSSSAPSSADASYNELMRELGMGRHS
jgi:hypothetical protein